MIAATAWAVADPDRRSTAAMRLVMTKSDRRGRLLAAVAALVRKSGQKMPSIAVPVENIFS